MEKKENELFNTAQTRNTKGKEGYDSLCLILLSNSKYEQSLQFQQFLFDYLRNLKQEHQNNNLQHRQYMIATEHSESCFTIGKLRFDETFSKNHILHNPRQLAIHKIGRGGGITFHCPGQLVLYPLFDLENSSFLQKNIKWFSDEFMLRSLCVPFLQQFSNDLLKDVKGQVENIEKGERIELNVGGESEMGIYISSSMKLCEQSDENNSQEKKRKLASIGLQLSRFVSMHGVAMNLNLSSQDLQSFRSDIVACGLHHVKMTSLANELKLEEISNEQYVHMMDILVAQLGKCHLNVDQIVHTDLENSKSKVVNFSEQEPSSELLNFINSKLFQKN
ncbi:predicted protein [Naegleria gruberi]|uniref:Predicted protein n=1 Tax=Naegleria gruberi TaxID=5762 RepID=D2V636_NAEGR|nr:uncharacterized protein NAEGRDRAFT_55158 [Naegleria gruberi]EFC47899.1 predicted protein [Naegleria gruberi]|eukprot:XP_002680643.1 predicted protein [Naegleria gruberi strain NEG-M]